MSQNKRKQTGKQSGTSAPKTSSESTPDESQNSTASSENDQTPDGEVLTPSGATMETGAGDPRTDAPADAPEGASTPEETVNGGGEGSDDADAAEGDDDPESETNPNSRVRGSGVAAVDLDEAPEVESAEPRHPVDQATGNIKWKPLPVEGEPEGRILEADDELAFDGEQVGNMVVVKEDVYRKVRVPGSERHTYTLLYRKGTQVPATAVQSK